MKSSSAALRDGRGDRGSSRQERAREGGQGSAETSSTAPHPPRSFHSLQPALYDRGGPHSVWFGLGAKMALAASHGPVRSLGTALSPFQRPGVTSRHKCASA